MIISYGYMFFTPTSYGCRLSIAKGNKTIIEQSDEGMVVSQLSKYIFKDRIYYSKDEFLRHLLISFLCK